jgi:hypothetical protein
MMFVSNRPRRRGPNPTPPARGSGRLLLLGCILAIVACSFPWTRVEFGSLWGNAVGPRGLHTSSGFTTLLTCLLSAMLVAFEGSSRSNREATRSACAMLMAAASLAMAAKLLRGAGMLKGVSAMHTEWFWLASLGVALGAWFGWRRFRMRTNPRIA